MLARSWLVAVPVLALVGVVASACSGGDNGGAPPKDAATEFVQLGHKMSDGATDDGGPMPFDGTSGKKCKTDVDCAGPDGGVGINRCSSAFISTATGVQVYPWATPICIVPPMATCDPAPPSDPTGSSLHFCDGPDDPSSPGYCDPSTTPPSPGMGVCVPKCTFALDGSPAKGCTGHNVCVPLIYATDQTTGAMTGYGLCQGFCAQDSDCSDLGTAFVCQADIGGCTKKKVTRSKQLGSACAVTSTAGTSVCNCVAGMSMTGYCSQSCVIGQGACPAGYECDNGTPANITITAQNPGTLGVCVATCQGTAAPEAGVPVDAASGDAAPAEAGAPLDAGGGAGAAGQCPASTTCNQTTAIGPNCFPQ